MELPGGAPAPPLLLGAETELYRRIDPSWVLTEGGRPYLSSMAYVPRRGEHCSAFVAAECRVEDVIAVYPDGTMNVGAITVGTCQLQNYRVQRDVLPGEPDSHVHLIAPEGLSRGQFRLVRKALAENTHYVSGPKSWDPPPAAAGAVA